MSEIDYSKIVADPERGTEIARLYMAAPMWDDSPTTVAAYKAFVTETAAQYATMVANGVKVKFTDADPYPDAPHMWADASRGFLMIYKTVAAESSPYLSPAQNDLFRAVHDYFGHYGAGNGAPRDFSRHGEEAAWVRHSQMYTPLARRAMTTETRGQNSVFIWINGGREFPVQKMTLLPEWVSELDYTTV